jgi:hypothetical protein
LLPAHLIVLLGIMLAIRLLTSQLMGKFRAVPALHDGGPIRRGGLIVIAAT